MKSTQIARRLAGIFKPVMNLVPTFPVATKPEPNMALDRSQNKTSSLFSKAKDLFLTLKHDFKTLGMKATFKKHGWKLFAIFFVYYLIRDSLLYIVIPGLVGYGLLAK
ncbi:hypothetical protein [Pseudobdellovibrio sp. HCB154]|uniref:hypothetical protein n=1 Tax=Pseudobdellovibrio sp. HCB154 TaxID=3386277 RepID=UPI0039170E4B